ncbi:MAG TPA: glucoamylase family protein [Vicinamibacterales bacterium]|nr:glucoamylase family protein [Vicinamibacterales bacterium]
MTKQAPDSRDPIDRLDRRHPLDPLDTDDALFDRLQRETFEYFLKETNPANGLVADKTRKNWPASIAATGLALAVYPAGVERGFMTRDAAARITLTTLRFFRDSPQSPEPNATGHHGFYYHFLDLKTGRRAWRCELSTIDSAFLLAGALAAAAYFDRDSEEELQIRTVADELYRRTDWRWAQHGGATVTHGWKPEGGFLKYRWEGYDEALLLYVLGLGSPTHPLPAESYAAWLSTYAWKKIYEYELLYAGPLFIHQLSHIWLDFRGIQDSYMRARGIDYFENSRRTTCMQQAYAIRNPHEFALYGKDCWGITASDGPGAATLEVNGRKRRFFDYAARGVPFGPDDGTLAPWAVVASFPFAPEIVLPTIRYFTHHAKLSEGSTYGFKASFNPTYPDTRAGGHGWVSPYHFGLHQGPIVLMIENYRSGLLWRLMRQCPYIVAGLRRAGFTGGWL